MNLKSVIIKLRCIQYLKKQLHHRKIPEVDQSISIILEQFIKKHKNDHTNKRQNFQFKVLNDVSLIKALRKRCYHYPIQYLLPNWYFRTLIIKLRPPLLIPRFQTQYFVSLMIQQIRKRWKSGSKLNIIDFCCGTGVIGLSLIKQLQAQYQVFATFIDINPTAINYTKINAEINSISNKKIRIIEGNMLDYFQLMKDFNIIVSNPPYLSQSKYKRLQKQVKLYQDPLALISGQQGMDLTNKILEYISNNQLIDGKTLIGIQYDGQSVYHLNLQHCVVNDQYGRRRYLIVA